MLAMSPRPSLARFRPSRGSRPTRRQLLGALAREPAANIEFVGFRRIYPRRAYPGGDPNEPGAETPAFEGVRVRNNVTWYNPLSWIAAGLTARGDVVHAQWWSYALAPMYITMLGIARMRGKRVLLTVHNVAPHEDGRVKRALNRVVFRLGHHYIVHSEQNRRELARIVGDPTRISVLPHGMLETPRSGMSRVDGARRSGLPIATPRHALLRQHPPIQGRRGPVAGVRGGRAAMTRTRCS